MDNYKEQLVKKGKDSSDTFKRLAVTAAGIIAAAILVVLSLQFIGNIIVGFLLAAVVLWGTYYILNGFYTEYEYIFTNGEIDIDKIMGQRKRKRLITVEIKSSTAFGKEKTAANSDVTLVDVSCRESDDNYYIDFRHRELGNTRLIFTPNEDMLELVEKYIPRTANRT